MCGADYEVDNFIYYYYYFLKYEEGEGRISLNFFSILNNTFQLRVRRMSVEFRLKIFHTNYVKN